LGCPRQAQEEKLNEMTRNVGLASREKDETNYVNLGERVASILLQ
jgi:hypothetical protein